jgi:hypothetical protein
MHAHTHIHTHIHTVSEALYCSSRPHLGSLPAWPVRRHMCDNCIVNVEQWSQAQAAPRSYLSFLYVGARLLSHARWTCIYGACECVIVKPMNINHLDSHMYHVLYFGVLICSSFGGVRSHVRTYVRIHTYRVSLLE